MNIKSFVVFIFGFVSCAAVLVPLALVERNNKYEHGQNQGYINGLSDAARSIYHEFGEMDREIKDYKVLFSIKTTDVVLIDKDGMKTIRTIN